MSTYRCLYTSDAYISNAVSGAGDHLSWPDSECLFRGQLSSPGFLAAVSRPDCSGRFGTLGTRRRDRRSLTVTALGQESEVPTPLTFLFLEQTLFNVRNRAPALRGMLSNERSEAPFLSSFMPVFFTVVSDHFLGGY